MENKVTFNKTPEDQQIEAGMKWEDIVIPEYEKFNAYCLEKYTDPDDMPYLYHLIDEQVDEIRHEASKLARGTIDYEEFCDDVPDMVELLVDEVKDCDNRLQVNRVTPVVQAVEKWFSQFEKDVDKLREKQFAEWATHQSGAAEQPESLFGNCKPVLFSEVNEAGKCDKPGWIYAANVLTSNGHEGVKIGKTIRPLQKRINEHLNSGQFHTFELFDAWHVSDVGKAESWIRNRLAANRTPVASGFNEVYLANISAETIENFLNVVPSDRGAEEWQVLNHRKVTSPTYKNQSSGVSSSPATDFSFFLWLLAFIITAPFLAYAIAGVVWAVVKTVTTVGWFFSTYTVPFLTCLAWATFAAIPIVACVFIYRYGMNAAKEFEEKPSLYAKPTSGFPEPPPPPDY